MSYVAEFYKLRKSGKNKGKYLFLRKMEIDQISELTPSNFFNIVSKSGKNHRYIIERTEHVYYDADNEYYMKFFIKEIPEW